MRISGMPKRDIDTYFLEEGVSQSAHLLLV